MGARSSGGARRASQKRVVNARLISRRYMGTRKTDSDDCDVTSGEYSETGGRPPVNERKREMDAMHDGRRATAIMRKTGKVEKDGENSQRDKHGVQRDTRRIEER